MGSGGGVAGWGRTAAVMLADGGGGRRRGPAGRWWFAIQGSRTQVAEGRQVARADVPLRSDVVSVSCIRVLR